MRARSSCARIALVLSMLAAVASTPACRRDAAREDGALAVDTALMAFLSAARALHHEANLKEESGDVDGAIRAMDHLVTAPRPHPERTTPEIEEVLADSYARLAELHLRKGMPDAAADAVTKGLTHAAGTTYFRGHLVEVQGFVEAARAAELGDAGKSGEAARMRDRAAAQLEEAVKIQEQVILRSLPADGGGDGAR